MSFYGKVTVWGSGSGVDLYVEPR